MKRCAWILLAILPTGCWACTVDPGKELAALSQETSRAIIHRLWDSGDCERVTLDGLSSGTSDWVALAVALKPYTDAWSSESLVASLGFAMLKAPSRVLPLVDNPAFGSRICIADFFDDSPEGIEAFWKRLPLFRTTYESFLATGLQRQARKCLEQVEGLEERQGARK